MARAPMDRVVDLRHTAAIGLWGVAVPTTEARSGLRRRTEEVLSWSAEAALRRLDEADQRVAAVLGVRHHGDRRS